MENKHMLRIGKNQKSLYGTQTTQPIYCFAVSLFLVILEFKGLHFLTTYLVLILHILLSFWFLLEHNYNYFDSNWIYCIFIWSGCDISLFYCQNMWLAPIVYLQILIKLLYQLNYHYNVKTCEINNWTQLRLNVQSSLQRITYI